MLFMKFEIVFLKVFGYILVKRRISMINWVLINIIMGFLGVGKIIVILYLLVMKFVYEKWVVFVNEFGEIGIDGVIMSE